MSFLDQIPPLKLNDPAVRELWNLLATNYQSKPPARQMLTDADIDTSLIDFDRPMRWVWSDSLTLAHRQAKLKALLQNIIDSGDAAIAIRVKELLADEPVTESTTQTVAGTWKAASVGGAEKVTLGDPTFLDVAFLRRGTELAAGVCRLLVTTATGRSHGTAFRITDKHLLTNHHMLFDHDDGMAEVTNVEIWFGYERTFAGVDLEPTVLQGDLSTIDGNLEHDWGVISTTVPMPKDTPKISIVGATPVKEDDRVYIIQHPSGSPKKIGMIHNVVRHVDPNVVQYLTDTEGGSSGSPVFNERWEVVALHHWWLESTTDGVKEIRNQGIRIERVAEGLAAIGVI